MGKGSSPPPPPDYTGLAREQAASNLEMARYQTQANRANQFTPYGSLTWEAPSNGTNEAAQGQLNTLLQNPPPQFLGGQQRGGTGYNPALSGWTGMGSPGTGPRRPNPAYAAWEQQVQAATAQANTPMDGQWTQRVTPTPEVQQLIDSELQMSQRYADLANNLFDNTQQAYGDGFGDYDFEAARRAELERQMQRMQPDLDIRRQQLETQLINQGVRPGSEAYDNAMRNFSDEVNRLRLSADLQAGSEAERALRMQNYMQDRPLSIVNALRTGAQPAQLQFSNYAQQGYVPGPDLMGAASNTYNAQMGAYNAQQAQRGNFMGGLFGLGAAALGAPSGGVLASLIS